MTDEVKSVEKQLNNLQEQINLITENLVCLKSGYEEMVKALFLLQTAVGNIMGAKQETKH